MSSPSSTVTFVDLNILPEDLRPHPLRTVGWLAATAIVAAAVWALTFVTALERDVQRETRVLAEQSARLEQQIRAADEDAARLAALRDALSAVTRAASALEAERETLVGADPLTAPRIAESMRVLPLGAEISLISAALSLDSALVLSGQATGPRAVLEYARVLERGTLFTNVDVTSIRVLDPDSDDRRVLFVVEAGW